MMRQICKHPRKSAAMPSINAVLESNRLTERDREILRAIGRHRMLTPRLLAEMFMTAQSESALVIIRRRLRALYDLGLIDRFFWDLGPGGGGSEQHVILTELGKQYLDGLYQTERVIASEVGFHLLHTLEVNEKAYLPVLRAARAERLEVEGVKVEVPVNFKGGRVIPDLAFKVFRPQSEWGMLIFLEWDRGTEVTKQLRVKVQRYEALLRVGGVDGIMPLVGFVTTNWDRVNKVGQLVHSMRGRVKWHLTAAAEYTKQPMGRIWVKPGALDNAVCLV